MINEKLNLWKTTAEMKNVCCKTNHIHLRLGLSNYTTTYAKPDLNMFLSKQILRAGTAIGALVSESEFAQSKADFANKLSVALKEANETRYWLRLLKDSEFIKEIEFSSIIHDT